MVNLKEKTTTERSPVIVIMGHIDHGKSALLDFIRKSNVVAGEAGGITQHTSAYEVEHKTKEGKIKKITFLDTPGHEAFSDMRLRGAIVADIAILIVSAEDGVKSQTLEALEAIKAASIPYIVAINKIDKPGADIEKTKNSLVENEIYIEGYGGDIPHVAISAKSGKGIPELLDMMLLVAEMSELTANTNKPAEGVVIEANVDPKKGLSTTLIIKDGTLKKGMFIASGGSCAPVRIFENFLGEKIDKAQFSSPVIIVGWNKLPEVGASFKTFEKKKEAETYALNFKLEKQTKSVSETQGKITKSDEGYFSIPIILKADVSGTLSAITQEISKIVLPRTTLKIIHTGVGAITENDVKTASGAKDSIIIGFNVSVDARTRSVAEQFDVNIETFNIIYKMTEWLEKEALKKTPEIEVEEKSGELKILKLFSAQKNVQIIGGKIIEGKIASGARVHILRRDNLIGEGKILGMQSQKTKIDEANEEMEIGAKVESKIEIAAGDTLESFTMVTK
ncbi:MAG: translation initiation factor IF-2 [Candidatus Pacebacteria bacterium]|nr:translation initiation factor IF-2 [Candidatus Paceibacterota bacterium]